MRSGTVAVVGVGETDFVRANSESILEMIVCAARAAIEDAGLEATDVDGFINSDGQPPLDEIATDLGVVDRAFTCNPGMRAGAASVGALIYAQLAIEAGLANNVLVTYGAKASRAGGPYRFHGEDSLKADLEMPVGFYGQPSYFAAIAQRYRHEYGLSEEDLASVAISARSWAQLTPKAQQRKPLDLAAYRASPMISTPLRVADCCLMTDGACAYLVTSLERARDLKRPPIVVRGAGAGASPIALSGVLTQNTDIGAFPADRSSRKAYAIAGMQPTDLDFVQVYDCFTISAIIQLELLGLAERGAGAELFASGRTRPGGDLPVNTSGGHLAQAYVPGANLLVEAVRQLRGERGDAQVRGAEIGAVAGIGGNTHATAVLSRDAR